MSEPSPTRKRSSLRLPPDDHKWWNAQVTRIAQQEKLLTFSLNALMHRIKEANLDFSLDAIAQYQSVRARKKRAA